MISKISVHLIFLFIIAFGNSEFWNGLKEGKYSKKITLLSEELAKPGTHINVSQKVGQIDVSAIPSQSDDTYVGVMAKTLVNSNVANILKVLGDVGSYKKIYPGLDEISYIKSKISSNDFEIHWKFSGPLGSHTIYDTVQTVSQIAPKKGLLVYQLKKSDDVLETDGFIFLEEDGDKTRYLSVDFFNAKWGIAGTFFKGKIWETTFDNTKQATLEIKKESELLSNPTAGASEKVVVNYIGLDDRKKQRTFENLEPEIFDVNKHDQ